MYVVAVSQLAVSSKGAVLGPLALLQSRDPHVTVASSKSLVSFIITHCSLLSLLSLFCLFFPIPTGSAINRVRCAVCVWLVCFDRRP